MEQKSKQIITQNRKTEEKKLLFQKLNRSLSLKQNWGITECEQANFPPASGKSAVLPKEGFSAHTSALR